jgi:XTP/dITP diphosphohydrolase
MPGSIKLAFATSNAGKFREASHILEGLGISTLRIPSKGTEIQADDLVSIAAKAAEESFARHRVPLFAEDSGLFIHGLGGFPGPYSSYAYRTIGPEGVLRLLRDLPVRSAEFVSAVGYCAREGPVRTFTGRVAGSISAEPRGSGGFGFDPLFVPRGRSKTFAEMTLDEKCAVSHRAESLTALARWLNPPDRG